MVADFDADIGGAIFVQNAKDHVTGLARNRDVPDLGAIIIPQPAFFSAELPEFKQGAQAAALYGVEQCAGFLAAADARDGKWNVSAHR